MKIFIIMISILCVTVLAEARTVVIGRKMYCYKNGKPVFYVMRSGPDINSQKERMFYPNGKEVKNERSKRRLLMRSLKKKRKMFE